MSRLRGISCTISDKEIDELEFDSLDIDDDGSSQTVQTDKRKNRSSDNDEAAKKLTLYGLDWKKQVGRVTLFCTGPT